MSTAQWILNGVLLAWVLLRNLGERRLRPALFVVPLLVVAVAAATFLRDLPTAGNDLTLELAGATAGLVLGTLATALTRLSRRDGDLVVTAGLAFAALWVAVIGGRVLFAQWATHSGAATVGEFSLRHQITGADAWTAAFVLMALLMVLGRLATTAAWAAVHRRRPAAVSAGSAVGSAVEVEAVRA